TLGAALVWLAALFGAAVCALTGMSHTMPHSNAAKPRTARRLLIFALPASSCSRDFVGRSRALSGCCAPTTHARRGKPLTPPCRTRLIVPVRQQAHREIRCPLPAVAVPCLTR